MASQSTVSENNQVTLRGVFAGEPVLRTLPSGDELVSFRITVSRPPGARARVDNIECSSTRPLVRRSVIRCQAGDAIELTGSLHRRFWRSPAGTQASRYEVEVSTLSRNRPKQ